MAFGEEPGSWNHRFCESCLKNAGEKIEMVVDKIGPGLGEFFVCPQCGATKRL